VPAIRVTICLLLLPLLCFAQAARDEEAAYRKVGRAREDARRIRSARTLARFEAQARHFLDAFPESSRQGTVHLWLGREFEKSRPREAYREYLRSRDVRGRRLATDLAFRHEAPPPLEVSRWIGDPVAPDVPTGEVKVLVFFSLAHPETRKALPRLERIHREFGPHGLRLAGIATALGDSPVGLADRLEGLQLPFPVAVDRPRPGERSVSLTRYRGGHLPRVAIIDRHGRITRLERLSLQANSLALLEKELAVLLEEPGYQALANQVRTGSRAALERLGTIRTKKSASVLAALARAEVPAGIRERSLALLRGLLPEGYLDPDPVSALRRWDREKGSFRYSFAADRIVSHW
jgi:hypothetical protein